MATNSLPKFKKPPVVETVLGVQFEPIPSIGSAHLGAYWNGLGEEWPHVSDEPPIDPQYERFDDEVSWGMAGLQFSLSRRVDVRLKIRNADQSRMIQVQNGRFHFNWLGGYEGKNYPSYANVRVDFDKHLDRFREFLVRESTDSFRPNQWEVTYVNHIPKGTLWNDPQDWASIVRLPESNVMPESIAVLESLGGEWHFEIPERQGRLHVSLSHRKRKEPKGEEILILKLTARGPIEKEKGMTLERGLGLGHATIVLSFTALTSDKAHKYWERSHD